MSDTTESQVAPPLFDDFEELPDAPPQRKLKFTLVEGKSRSLSWCFG